MKAVDSASKQCWKLTLQYACTESVWLPFEM